MTAERDLVAAANESLVASYRTLAEHGADGETRERGRVFGFSTGLPFPMFNGCIALEPDREAVEWMLAWLEGRDVPFLVWAPGEASAVVRDVAGSRAVESEPLAYPGMVLHPVPDPHAAATGVTVATGPDCFEDFLGVTAAGGIPDELARRLYTPSFLADPDVQSFVGLLDGQPVGTAVAIRSVLASGVVAVATLPAARRRGVGSALTWAAIRAGVEWGCDTVVLQSSPMALAMYERMGFRTVVPYAVFASSGV